MSTRTAPRVADLDAPPVVGRYYRVPCVLVAHWNGQKPIWMPILGPAHSDPEIGVPTEHWHYDHRFIGDRLARRYWRGEWSAEHHYNLRHIAFLEMIDAGPEERAMRCVREMPDFPFRHRDSGRPIRLVKRLEELYAGACLKTCQVCPHRGIPLRDLPATDGLVVCPGHGLQWDLRTGKLVKRGGAA